MTDLESDLFLVFKFSPWVLGDKVEAVHVDNLAVLCFRIITVGNIDNVPLDVLFDNEPRSSAQA